MKTMKIDDLGGLGSKIGNVVGHGLGRNLELGSIPGTVVLKPILQRLAWNYSRVSHSQTQPPTIWLGTILGTIMFEAIL